MKKQFIISIISIITAIIFLQTLFFKFSGSSESIYIFKAVGLEPFGRIGIGILELIASLLLINKKTILFGALLSFGIISGAIVLHLTKLGIEVMNDGGLLFYLAIIIFVLSILIIYLKKEEFHVVINQLFFKKILLQNQ